LPDPSSSMACFPFEHLCYLPKFAVTKLVTTRGFMPNKWVITKFVFCWKNK
jgi:hypothetical protein